MKDNDSMNVGHEDNGVDKPSYQSIKENHVLSISSIEENSSVDISPKLNSEIDSQSFIEQFSEYHIPNLTSSYTSENQNKVEIPLNSILKKTKQKSTDNDQPFVSNLTKKVHPLLRQSRQSQKDSKNGNILQWLRNVKDDDLDLDESFTTNPMRKKRQIQFDLKDEKINLKVHQSPYLKSLKLSLQDQKSIKLKKLKHVQHQKKFPNETEKVILDNHRISKHTKNIDLNELDLFINQQLHKLPDTMDDSKLQLDQRELDLIESYMKAGEVKQPIDISHYQDDISIPEKNLLKFFEMAETTIPLTDTIPKFEKEKVWKNQLKLTKKSLDDRLWTQKVNMQKYLQELGDTTPLDQLIKELRDSKRLNEIRQHQNELQNVQRKLHDRFRSIKHMTHKMETINDLTQRKIRKQKFFEQQLTKGLMDEYIKKQRKTLLEERRELKKIQNDMELKRKLEREKQEIRINQQIQLLKEQIAETEREELYLQMAQTDELRKIVQETKLNQSRHIEKLKKSIPGTWNDHYRPEQSKSLKYEFKAQKRVH
ncbi:hypothetical protein BC833DRAFT_607727 [Globomyces pollinis-pini]|nr:hypothetical protein BC833DRAFT_607727 [Globomyces pollinis-pini]